MQVKYIALLTIFTCSQAIYPYFDTQDFIYNVPKVYRISIVLDKLLDYYERKPSKDPEWYIALGMTRGQLEYTINELDKAVPEKLKENLKNITRRIDRARKKIDVSNLVYRSKDYEYEQRDECEQNFVIVNDSFKAQEIHMKTREFGYNPFIFGFLPLKLKLHSILNTLAAAQILRDLPEAPTLVKAVFENMDVLSSVLEPITLGTMGTQKPYRFKFEQYLQEARTKMPSRKAADACTMQLLISAMETQTTQSDGVCEMTPECSSQIIKGSALAFQQTSRLRAAVLASLFDCMEGLDVPAHIYKLCIQIYKETKSLEVWDHPPGTKTLFMQQILYCASQGYGEFVKPRWMNKIIAWQQPKGCYADDRQPFMKLTGFVGASTSPTFNDREEEYRVKKAATSEGGACNSLTSAMALGSLVLYIRTLLETDQAFQYDVLV